MSGSKNNIHIELSKKKRDHSKTLNDRNTWITLATVDGSNFECGKTIVAREKTAEYQNTDTENVATGKVLNPCALISMMSGSLSN